MMPEVGDIWMWKADGSATATVLLLTKEYNNTYKALVLYAEGYFPSRAGTVAYWAFERDDMRRYWRKLA